MHRNSSAVSEIFRKTAAAALFLEMIALLLSLIFSQDILKVSCGLFSGYDAGLVKLRFTLGMVSVSFAKNAGRKAKISYGAANILGYALLAAVPLALAGWDKTAFIASLAGILNVYLGIPAYMAYAAARSRKEKKDGLK